MYTLIIHSNSFWPVQPTSMCKHAYLVEIFIILLSGQFFFLDQHVVRSGNWVLSCWICMEILFQNQFSGWLKGVSINSAVGRQSLIPKLVRDVKTLKKCFYDPLHMSPLRPCQPSDTDTVQHPPTPQHPFSYDRLGFTGPAYTVRVGVIVYDRQVFLLIGIAWLCEMWYRILLIGCLHLSLGCDTWFIS